MQARREILKRAAWLLGGAISAPAALAILQGCSAKESPATAGAKLDFLNAVEFPIVAEIAEILIPKTETSGAKDAGVPAFGPTLLYSPPETLAMLKAWLSFYRTHQTALSTGKFSTFGQLGMPNHQIEFDNETFAYVRNLGFAEMSAQGKNIFLMNATGIDRFIGKVHPPEGANVYSARVLSRYLVAEPHEIQVAVDSRGVLNLNIAVQQGGMVVLTPVEANRALSDPVAEQ